MKRLIVEAMNVKQLEQRIESLEAEVKRLRELCKRLEDLPDDKGGEEDEADGSWYSNHGHGD